MTEGPDYDERGPDLRRNPRSAESPAGTAPAAPPVMQDQNTATALPPNFAIRAFPVAPHELRGDHPVSSTGDPWGPVLARQGLAAPGVLFGRVQRAAAPIVTLPEKEIGEIIALRLRLMQFADPSKALTEFEKRRSAIVDEIVAGTEAGREDSLLRLPEDLLQQVAKFESDQRRFIAERAMDWVGTIVRSRTPTDRIIDAEMAEIGLRVVEYDRGRNGYITMRPMLLKAFGSTWRARHYYADVQSRELTADEMFEKRSAKLHRLVIEALKKAETKYRELLKKTGAPRDQIDNFGAFNVRANVNAKSLVSPHGFGIGIDLNPGRSPNIKTTKFKREGIANAWLMISEVTGEDPSASTEFYCFAVHKLDASITDERIIREVERIFRASAILTERFKNPEDLIIRYLAGKQIPINGETARWILDNFRSIPAGERLPAERKLVNILRLFASRRRDQESPEDEYDLFHAATVLCDVATANDRAQAYQECKDLTASEPSIGQIVKCGFMNIPPLIVAALVSKNGGNLRWLGANRSGDPDFMHFELKLFRDSPGQLSEIYEYMVDPYRRTPRQPFELPGPNLDDPIAEIGVPLP